MTQKENRRLFLTLASSAWVLGACHQSSEPRAEPRAPIPTPAASGAEPKQAEKADKDEADEDVGAVEDLMREHGVIRRILVVYRESAARLRVKPASVPPEILNKAASLLQTFGENYHEKLLEEAHLFPAVKKAGGPAAGLVDTLIAQHQRGREPTASVLSATQGTIGAAHAEPLARVLEGFARMYEEHAAQEDTIVFQAWKKALSKRQLNDMGELFEDIEHKTFGKDGFDDASEKIANIEAGLGITLAGMMAPPAPA